MKQSPFRAWISYWLFVCMLCVLTSLGCHSVHLVRAVAQHGQPYIPVATEERFKECAGLVEKNIEPRLYSVLDAGGSIDQKADGTTTFTRSDGVAVTYDKAGYPDFTPYRHPTVKDVQIEFTGSYPKDFVAADKAAGITSKLREAEGYTWHHHQDGKTMQLIRKDVHLDFFHTGGMSGTRQQAKTMQMDTTNPYGATTPDAIAEFEARRGIVLPAEYKAFLLTSNGGMPIPENFEIPGFHGQGSALTSFYGLHHGPEHNRLARACEVHKNRIPFDLIPIAWDAFGNEVCIGWTGERKGKIYFWDHEDELDEDGDFVRDYRNVFLVANSLQEFLDGLMTLEEFETKHPTKQT